MSWSHHLLILSDCKSEQEREFYIRLAIKEHYDKRELEQLMESACYERCLLSQSKVMPELSHWPTKQNPLLDSYFVEFLDLPKHLNESDLHTRLILQMQDFIRALDMDFTFVGQDYSLQIDGKKYPVDLLLFHRGLHCLVAIELIIGKCRMELNSRMDFYLEGLDRQSKKPEENASVGLLLCVCENQALANYILSQTLSPGMAAKYQRQLPDSDVLQRKLQQLCSFSLIEKD